MFEPLFNQVGALQISNFFEKRFQRSCFSVIIAKFLDALKTSQKRHLFRDLSERSLRNLSQWRSDWDLSETSHTGWDIDTINALAVTLLTLTFNFLLFFIIQFVFLSWFLRLYYFYCLFTAYFIWRGNDSSATYYILSENYCM